MFKHVMVAVDGGPETPALWRGLRDLYALGTRDVLLARPVAATDVEGLWTQLQEIAGDQLKTLQAEVAQLGFNVTVEAPVGMAGLELARLARERDVQLVVVCGAAKGVWGDLLLAPMAHAALHFVAAPILVRHPTDATAAPFLHHLLHPTDFSDHSERVFAQLRKLVRAGARHVTLAHVQSVDKLNPYLTARLEEFDRVDTARLEEKRQALLADGATRVELALSAGKPQVELLRLAGQDAVSLVVMGTQGRGFFGELMVGSVSHYLARRAPAPVLLIP